jgi:hypothetical protein
MVFSGQAQNKPAARLPVEKNALQIISVYSGQLTEWISDDDYVYNGFYVQSNDKRYLVKFPTSMGLQLTIAMKKGDAISVSGVDKAFSSTLRQIDFVSITANGQDIYNIPSVEHNLKPLEEFINGSGKITKVQVNKQGVIKSFVVDDKTVLRVSPNIGRLLSKVIAVGNPISFKGMKKNLRIGESTSIDVNIVKCQTITFNGIQYLTRE